jgi:hypothetical protein
MKTILERINEKIDHFQTNATSHIEKANKAAGIRARKASLELEKMLKDFRKKSLTTQHRIAEDPDKK